MEAASFRDKESTGWIFTWSGRLDIQAELPAAGLTGEEQGPCRSSAPRCEWVTETRDFLPDKHVPELALLSSKRLRPKEGVILRVHSQLTLGPLPPVSSLCQTLKERGKSEQVGKQVGKVLSCWGRREPRGATREGESQG